MEQDTYTQFSYACKQLGVEIKTTSVAQAKGRVERAFQTLQQRLPIALRLAGITTLSEANAFLNSYISVHNHVYELDMIPEHERKSRNFDFDPVEEKPKKRIIPSMKHPWRKDAFLKYRNHYLSDEMLTV